jgi:hypothetical protein
MPTTSNVVFLIASKNNNNIDLNPPPSLTLSHTHIHIYICIHTYSYMHNIIITPYIHIHKSEFRWGHYILDSRSIWWNNKRHLVPLLDLINCGEGKNASKPIRVHQTKLTLSSASGFKVDTADTLSATDIAVGEQV